MNANTPLLPQNNRRALGRQTHSQDPDDANIDQLITALAGIYPSLPAALSTARRRGAASLRFDDGSRLVRALVRLLRHHQAELAEAQEDPDDLERLQDRADRLNRLRAQLHLVVSLVDDAYLDAQTQAVARTRAAAHRVRVVNQVLRPKNDAGYLLREALLAPLDALDPRSPGADKKQRGARSR